MIGETQWRSTKRAQKIEAALQPYWLICLSRLMTYVMLLVPRSGRPFSGVPPGSLRAWPRELEPRPDRRLEHRGEILDMLINLYLPKDRPLRVAEVGVFQAGVSIFAEPPRFSEVI